MRNRWLGEDLAQQGISSGRWEEDVHANTRANLGGAEPTPPASATTRVQRLKRLGTRMLTLHLGTRCGTNMLHPHIRRSFGPSGARSSLPCCSPHASGPRYGASRHNKSWMPKLERRAEEDEGGPAAWTRAAAWPGPCASRHGGGDWLQRHQVPVRISWPRASKLGDYRVAGPWQDVPHIR